MSFFNELKRRNVFKVAAAYVIVGWLIMQAGEVMAPALNLPGWVNSLLAFFLILGFPLALFFAWAYEMTPEGIKKEKDVDRSKSITSATGQKLNGLIIGILVLALGYFAIDKFVLDPRRDVELVAATKTETAAVTTEQEMPDGTTSIAVMPFINMSEDANNEFFSDGITEELLNLLAKIPELKVTSRSSAFSFKGQNIDIPTVAKKLNVEHILEGSVRKAGNRVRITAQLIKVDSDTHMWSETYDRELVDVFGIQDEISREVVNALQIQLFGRAPSATLTDTEAYTLYLKGKHFHTLGGRESWETARSFFDEAIAIDPDYAPAWAALSFTLGNLANMSYINQQEGYESARQAAIRALEIDDTLADAWAALALVQISQDWDWDKARGTILTALQYGPRNVVALENAAAIVRNIGEHKLAIDYAKRAVELDPLSVSSLRNLGITYWATGQYAKAEKIYRQVLELHPELENINAFVAVTLYLQGKSEEAAEFIDISSENPWQKFANALVLTGLGREQQAADLMQHMIDEYGDAMAFQIAGLYAVRGYADQAFEWLERAYQQRDSGIIQVSYDPSLRSLYNDPRWQEFLVKVGMQDYWKMVQAERTGQAVVDGGAQ